MLDIMMIHDDGEYGYNYDHGDSMDYNDDGDDMSYCDDDNDDGYKDVDAFDDDNHDENVNQGEISGIIIMVKEIAENV